MHFVEGLGLVKIDLLGNRALSIVHDCAVMLGQNGVAVPDLAQVAEDDPRLSTVTVNFSGADGQMSGYLAMPTAAAGAKLPAVVVIHENRGINAHIKDVVRRTALEGFVALGPDLLAPAGGTPADEDKARDMIGALDVAKTVGNAVAAITALARHPASTGKVGTIGFCWGGGIVNRMAVAAGADLAAAVPFYGPVPPATDVPRIKARMLLHYAGLDERINAGIPGYKAALEAAKVDFTIHMYDGVNHAFHNDTVQARYDKAAAELAWSRTVAFLRQTLA